MTTYIFHEIDDFTGQVDPEPMTEFSCAPELLERIANQITAFYRIIDKETGLVALERTPKRMVAGRQTPVIDLFYGVLTDGQAETLFDGGKPGAQAFKMAADLVRHATALPVVSQGRWVPQEKPPAPARTELDLAPIGRIDYDMPCAIVRVNFIRP